MTVTEACRIIEGLGYEIPPGSHFEFPSEDEAVVIPYPYCLTPAPREGEQKLAVPHFYVKCSGGELLRFELRYGDPREVGRWWKSKLY